MNYCHLTIRSISSFSYLRNLLFLDRFVSLIYFEFFMLKITFLLRFTIFYFSYIYTFLLLAPIATCVSTENVLRKELRTAFEPNGSFNWMIHNLEEKGKFSPILLIYCAYFILIICYVVLRFLFQDRYLIVRFNDYIN